MNHSMEAASLRPKPRAAAEPRERLESGAGLTQLRSAAVLLALMVALKRDGVVVGSALVAQDFRSPGYFHPRPSAVGFDAASSGASNLAPTNAALIEAVRDRAEAWRALNDSRTAPVDAVTSSGSGLDPHISVANAMGQAARVADARGIPAGQARALVAEQTEAPWLGFVGAPRVNVFLLNLALDAAAPAASAAAGGATDE